MIQNSRPLILVTNDDGYQAGGIRQLTEMLLPFGEVVVVAPDSGRSGAAMAITSQIPVSLKLVEQRPGVTVYACSGSPVDCVKLAFHSVVQRHPSLLVSGINYGDNSGINAHYSGTVGAMLEGCLKHVPSLAFSSCDFDTSHDFMPFAPVVQQVVQWTLNHGLPVGGCLNVNFPSGSSYKGIRVARQDEGAWLGEWQELPPHRDGKRHFWLTGNYRSDNPMDETTDKVALSQGYVSITPTTIDLTHYALLEQLKEEFGV